MKLYLRITYGWLKAKHSTGIDELEQSLTDSLKPFGFEQTGSKFDSVSGVKGSSFEADEFKISLIKQYPRDRCDRPKRTPLDHACETTKKED